MDPSVVGKTMDVANKRRHTARTVAVEEVNHNERIELCWLEAEGFKRVKRCLGGIGEDTFVDRKGVRNLRKGRVIARLSKISRRQRVG